MGHGADEKIPTQGPRCSAAKEISPTLPQLGKIEIAQARDLGCERFGVE
jgi:hypothetical protein